MRRSGFTLVELVVAMVIAGIIAVALTRLVVSQARFVSAQDGLMQARSTSRSALNVLGDELHMVSEGGLRAAARDSVTARVPYAYGVACTTAFGTRVVGLIPADSAAYASAVLAGWAWRDTVGTWHFVEPGFADAALVTRCTSSANTNPPVSVLSAGSWTARAAALTPNVTAIKIGAPVYLYQLVTYRFAPSVEVPGTRALWRSVSGGANEELVAPFDTTARFSFIIGDTLGIVSTPPASLDSVRGLRVRLTGRSATIPEGKSTPTQFDVTTSLLFRGRARF